jgi:RNA polymerase sigma-70 factor (ECF subfamily)
LVDETQDHESLVTAAASGDVDAFEELYRRFARFVHGVLMARLPADEVDDVAQETFAHAWSRLSGLREPARFAGWLAVIARHRAADHMRSRPRFFELGDGPSSDGSPAEMLEAKEVLSAIRSLPEAYRETLSLRLVQGYSGPEIAALTGLSPGSVRVNLHRGMNLLRQKLGAI